MLEGGRVDGTAASLAIGREPALVLRLLPPGDVPKPQPLCYPRLDSVIHSTDLYAGVQPHELTPCSRVLLERLPGSQLVKKFRTFSGARRLSLS